MAKDLSFLKSKGSVVENLEAIKLVLVQCVDEGMIDTNDYYYNEILDLLENTTEAHSWDELMEIITKSKTLEIEVAGFLSFHGKTTISYPWPKKPKL